MKIFFKLIFNFSNCAIRKYSDDNEEMLERVVDGNFSQSNTLLTLNPSYGMVRFVAGNLTECRRNNILDVLPLDHNEIRPCQFYRFNDLVTIGEVNHS
jgi:hypothetical protein